MPDVEFEALSLGFAVGDDFTEGFGGASEHGGFGSRNPILGSLNGSLYDFKQDRKRRSRSDSDPLHFARIVGQIQLDEFSANSFAPYYRAPNRLSLTHLAIPICDAREGPWHFGAEQYINPRMWLAHYSGEITALEPGAYRFVGIADDYLSVFLDGVPALIAHRPDIPEGIRMSWHPAADSGQWSPPFSEVPLFVGDWIEFPPDKSVHLDLAIGERPGQALGFMLMVQRRGERYRKAVDGRPILPLFTTRSFSEMERTTIARRFPNYQLEWERVPVFPAR